MTGSGPRPRDGAYGTDSEFGYRDETPEQRRERRARNFSVFVAVFAVLVLLGVLAVGWAVLFVLHAFASMH